MKIVFCAFADPAAAYYYLSMIKSIGRITFLAVLISWTALVSWADQIIMQNGDVLNGKVLTMTTNTLVLENENLGTVKLPRGRVANITLGAVMVKVPVPAPSAAPQGASATASSMSGLQAILRGIRDQSNLVQQVEAQVMGTSANPEAVNKFNELLDGLSTGKIDMNELRAQAQSAANQLQQYKKEMGPEAGDEIDSYLTILNNFLQETAPANGSTSSPAP
jgi:hypothetical protein